MGAFMKRPSYRASYETMLAGQRNLPKWMATPDAVADSTTLKISKKVVDEKVQSVFEMCKPDQCDVTGFIVIFSENGETAKGLLLDGDDVFFGGPSEGERKALLKIKNSD